MCGRTMHTQLDKLKARLPVTMRMSSELIIWRQNELKAEIAKTNGIVYIYNIPEHIGPEGVWLAQGRLWILMISDFLGRGLRSASTVS